MKKAVMIASALAILMAPFGAALAQDPHQATFRFECPNASGGVASERLTNYGTHVSGMGELNIDGAKVSLPVFKGIPSPGVPLDLSTGGYSHAGTLYNAKSGRVTCLYSSAIRPAFNVSYVADNVKKGFVLKSSN